MKSRRYQNAEEIRKQFPAFRVLVLMNPRGDRYYLKKNDKAPEGVWCLVTYWE